MPISSVRMRSLCCLGIVLLLLSVPMRSAQSAFDASKECYELNAKMGKEDAIRFWTGPAESGDRQAQFCLGLAIYPSGGWIGAAPDPEEQAREARIALEWIRRSAEQGFAPAQEYLAQAYATGDAPFGGVARDLNKALYWMQQAANQGGPFANVFLGQWYRDGEQGLPIDKQRAYRHIRLSVELFRVQLEPSEFQGLMGFFGLGHEAVRLASGLSVEDRAEADAWVRSQVQTFLKHTNAKPPTGSYAVVAEKYVASVQSGAAEETDGQMLIKVDPKIEMTVRGECLPQENPCRIVIFWFYSKADSVEFSDGAFVARSIEDHNIQYGSTPTGSEHGACRNNCENDQEIGKSTVVWLGEHQPEEFEFVMPALNVNGKEKEMPVIYFKHVRIVEELAPLY